ncbi:MAG TPA: hypothetical protein VJ831_14735 [Jatrophihabitantaceae bacterium]|nr:hypothetical protein [Jatrophihabitantaceae bacterium]
MSTTEETADSAAPDKLPAPPAPRSIKLAMVAIVMYAVFTLARSISMFGFSDELQRLLIKANNDLKVKDRKSGYTFDSSKVLDDLHTVRVNGLWQSIVIVVAVLLLAYSLRRVGTASVTRWALVIVMVLTGGPFTIIPAKGLPVVPQVSLVLAGVASLAALALLFFPDSRAYFREMAARRRGELQAIAPDVPRPSLRSLFSTKPQANVSLEKPPAPDEPPRTTSRAGKSKRRSDAEAVARGAELARARAKANKGRRSEN